MRNVKIAVVLAAALSWAPAAAADRTFEFVVTCAGGYWSNTESVQAGSLDAALKKLCPRDCGKFSRGSYPNEKCLEECASTWRLGIHLGEFYASADNDCRYVVRQKGK